MTTRHTVEDSWRIARSARALPQPAAEKPPTTPATTEAAAPAAPPAAPDYAAVVASARARRRRHGARRRPQAGRSARLLENHAGPDRVRDRSRRRLLHRAALPCGRSDGQGHHAGPEGVRDLSTRRTSTPTLPTAASPTSRSSQTAFDKLDAPDGSVDVVTWFQGPHELYCKKACGNAPLGDPAEGLRRSLPHSETGRLSRHHGPRRDAGLARQPRATTCTASIPIVRDKATAGRLRAGRGKHASRQSGRRSHQGRVRRDNPRQDRPVPAALQEAGLDAG